MAKVVIISKSKPIPFKSPYKAVIWDILIRHGYTPAQIQEAEYHAHIHQPIEWSKMVHVIIELVKDIERNKTPKI